MATENPYAKYAIPQQGGAVITPMDPYAGSAEQRAQEDQSIQREQLGLSQRSAARADEAADRAAREWNATHNPDGTPKPEVAPESPDRRAQIKTLLDNLTILRDLADQRLAVGSWSKTFRDNPLLGQNRMNIEGSIEQIEGDLIQQQIAVLSAINGGNGVSTMANSETEARRMAASIANLSPDQDREQFNIGIDRAENFYLRQAARLLDTTPDDPNMLREFLPQGHPRKPEPIVSPPKMAGAGATETSDPIPPEMQAEYSAYLNQNWGNIDPQAYAAFRDSLDRKYNYPEQGGNTYIEEAQKLRQTAQQGGTPESISIPAVNRELSSLEQARNDAVSSGMGAFTSAYMNAAGFGIPSLLEGERSDLIREGNALPSFAGDLFGGVTGTTLGGMGLTGLAGRVSNPTAANVLSNPLTADVAYGTVFGATQADDPLLGAAIGAGSAGIGNRLGGFIGQRLPGVRPTDPLGRGERAVMSSAGDTDEVAAALAQASDLGVPATLSDVSPELGSLAGSATRFSPTQAGTARSVMAQRNQGQLDRLAAAVERDLGPVTNIPQRSEDLIQQARAQAGPLYDAAYAAPGAENVNISDLAGRPTFDKALREAYSEVLDEGLDPSAAGLELIDDGVFMASPSWQSLDYVKRGLDNIIERGLRQGDMPEVRRAQQMKQSLLTRMDEVNPTYAQARQAYAGPAAERTFLELGEQAGRSTPDQLGVDFARMTPEQQAQMRLGNQSQMMTAAGNLRSNSNPWAQLNTPSTEGRLGVMYGDDEIARLLSQRDLELQLAGNANRLIGNSETASRGIADEFFKQNPSNLIGDVGTGIAETALLGGPWMSAGRGIANRFMRNRGEQAALEANRSLADEIGPLLLDPNPQAAAAQLGDLSIRDAEYQDLLLQALEQAQRRGGHVGAGALASPISTSTGF